MYKNISQILILFLVTFGTAHSENIQIGTGGLASLIGMGNIYVQVPLKEKAALTFEYLEGRDIPLAPFDSVTAWAVIYKIYSQAYANGRFWKFGVARAELTDDGDITEGYLPVIIYGSESTTSSGMIYGFEGGLGTTAGAGLFSVYIGFQI